MQNVDQTGAELAHLEAGQLRRQRRAQCVDFTRDLVVFLVRVGTRAEFDCRDCDAVRHRRLDLVHIVELGESVFDGLGHQPFQVFWIRARIDRGDQKTRELQIGVLFPGHALEGEGAQNDQAQEDDYREGIALEWKFQK